MRKHTAEELHAIKLRVNRDLLEEIRRLAQADSRSVNGYLTARMLEFVRQDTKAARRHK